MKRALSIVLTIFMTLSMFSCLGVASYAMNTAESISYTMSNPIELIENQDGYWNTRWVYDEETEQEYEEEYFYYWVPSLGTYINEFIVTYPDGTSDTFVYDENDGSYLNAEGEYFDYYTTDSQCSEPWVLGSESEFTICAYGAEVSVPVTIIEDPIESISYTLRSPIEYIENTNGYWDTRWVYDEETEEEHREEYFYYWTPSMGDCIEKFTINYTDGTHEDFVFDYDMWGYYNDEGEYFSYDSYSNQSSKPWVLGSDNAITVYAYGKETKIPVTILENPVASISYTMKDSADSIEFTEEMGGYWDTVWNGDDCCGDDSYTKYYYYEVYEYHLSNYIDKFVVNYTDGTSDDFVYGWEEEYGSGYYNADGEYFNYGINTTQRQNPWTLGSDNELTISAFGREVTVPVTILENPVESFTYTLSAPMEIIEHTNGYWSSNGGSDSGSCDDSSTERYRYNVYLSKYIGKFTVNYTDGTSKDFVYDRGEGRYRSDDGEYFEYDTSYDSQYYDPWVVGGEYPITIYAYGREATASVKIVENPVSYISFTPAKPLVIMSHGSWYDTSNLFKKNGNIITLNYKNGTSEDFIYDGEGFVSESGEYLKSEYFDYEDEYYWDSCGTYSFEISYLGAETEIPVEIVSGDIDSISFKPKKPVKYIYNHGFNIYETGNVIAITYSDGRTVDYEYKFDEKQGLGWYDADDNTIDSRFSIDVYSDDVRHIPGKKGTGTIELYNNYNDSYTSTTFTYTVDVVPVKSVSVKLSKEITLIHNIDSTKEYYDYDFDYYYFNASLIPDGTAVTVNYKNGTSDTFYKKTCNSDVAFVNKNGDVLDYDYYTNQYENHWKIGTNYVEFFVYGASTEFPVTVLAGPVSMEVIPSSPLEINEHSNAYLTTDNDDKVYYRYYLEENVCREGWKIVLNYENGSSIEYTTAKWDMGEWYAFDSEGNSIRLNVTSNQYEQPWVVGGTNSFDVEYCALSDDVAVTIIDDPAHDITVGETVEPTCTNDGYTTYRCDGCQESIESDYVSRKGHNFVDSVCVNCGLNTENANKIDVDVQYELEQDTEFVFTAPETGEYKFESYGNGDPRIDLYKGSDKYYADDNNGYDFRLYINLEAGETVVGTVGNYRGGQTIIFDVTYMDGEGSGDGDDNLHIGDIIVEGEFEAEIVSENTCIITYIDTEAKELTVPSQIKGYTVVGFAGYSSPRSVEVLNLPETITELYSGSFRWWESLKEVNISENNAYYKSQNGIVYDYSLENVIIIPNAFCGDFVIPLSTTELSEDMLTALKNANSVSVAKGHTSFIEENGIIYNSDFTKIFFAKQLPANYVMKQSVTDVAPYAFAGNETVKSAKISANVTELSYAAFAGCSALEAVDLPEGLLLIDESAFADNTALKALDLPSSTLSVVDSAFANCSSLKDISLNEGLVYVGSCAFEGTAIEKIVLPDSLWEMGYKMFADCKSLSQVDFGDGISYISSGAFLGCTALKQINIPSNIKNINGSAFAGSGLTSINIPANVKYIYDYVFSNCKALKTVKIDKGLRYIEAGCFSGCSSLTSINIPDSVTGIYKNAFSGCSSLESLSIPDSVTYMGGYTFSNCSKLTNIKLPKNVTSLTYHQFDGCTSLQDFDIPSTLLEVDGFALDNTGWYNSHKDGDLYFKHILYGYKNAKTDNMAPAKYTVDVKLGTKSVANYAFQNQSGVTKVKLPYTMEYIGYAAFYNCENLTSIVIPESVTYIGGLAIGYTVERVYDEQWGNYYDRTVAIPDFVIYGVPGSAAEEYAIENGFKFEESCAHKTTKWVTDKDATCTKTGTKHKECTVCKEVLETGTIAKKAHTPSSWITDKKATVDKAGKKHKECKVCKEVLETAKIKQLKCSKPKLREVENTSKGVKISWSKVSGADSYRVYRKTGKKDWEYIGSTSKRSYTDKKAKSGTKYSYAIRAKNEAGNSSLSKSLSIEFLTDPTLKTPKSTKKGIALEWSKVKGADGYIIYRKTGSGKYEKLKTIKGYKKVEYTDKKAKKGKKYTYKVKAYDGKTYSAYSNTKTIKDKY